MQSAVFLVPGVRQAGAGRRCALLPPALVPAGMARRSGRRPGVLQ